MLCLKTDILTFTNLLIVTQYKNRFAWLWWIFNMIHWLFQHPSNHIFRKQKYTNRAYNIKYAFCIFHIKQGWNGTKSSKTASLKLCVSSLSGSTFYHWFDFVANNL